MKKCNGPCGLTKEDPEFGKKAYPNGKVGLRAYCKLCNNAAKKAWVDANPERDNARNLAYNKANAEEIRGKKLRKNYWPEGTWEQALANHKALLIAQDSKCAICSKAGHPTRGLHVDHCHATGKVRGLLCYNCNEGIGRLKDDTRILLEAVAYITRHKVSQ